MPRNRTYKFSPSISKCKCLNEGTKQEKFIKLFMKAISQDFQPTYKKVKKTEFKQINKELT